ncbi:MAG TPA: adenine methyltransferase [Firmicutes bacterium]|nr:adenine methyltransferase [Bacillota bacterium]
MAPMRQGITVEPKLGSISWSLLDKVEFFRIAANQQIDRSQRSKMGQFLTPAPVAGRMASMFDAKRPVIRLLDAGAGVGTLCAAFVAELCNREYRPQRIEIAAYEIEPVFLEYLKETLAACQAECQRAGIDFSSTILDEDFIEAGVSLIRGNLFSSHLTAGFDCAILNPPYRKIHSKSKERLLLRSIGVETSNLYAGFLSVVIHLLGPEGELVAITPRSFCNGPYFKPFRKLFLSNMVLRQVHLFNARSQAFKDDGVLQENVIFHAIRGGEPPREVVITSSEGPGDDLITERHASYSELVTPNDPDYFIHIPTDRIEQQIADRMQGFRSTLAELGLEVSTGRVVDFRTKGFLRANPGPDTVPLIYPGHFDNGGIRWPQQLRGKPNAIVRAPETEELLVPPGVYVLVKRFSTKEERKRVVAAIYDSAKVFQGEVAFENHLNYFHQNGGGLDENLAKGLAVFLNSTVVDAFFRQFNGHTQVNATDLRKLRYPTKHELEALGVKVGNQPLSQDEIDRLVEEGLVRMADEGNTIGPIRVKKRIDEAIEILKALGLPRNQVNERSALTLLALLDMKPDTPWSQASPALRGITEMMAFFKEHYGKEYAPNTRETVRRFTVHQFIQARLVVQNPDDPDRPTNSPNNRYQVDPMLLNVLRAYGTAEWTCRLKEYLASVGTLRDKYARRRNMRKVPVRLKPGRTLELSPGGQNELIKQVIEEFCPRFTPGADVIYVGDTARKWAYFDPTILADLGVIVSEHGKMPDVVVYLRDRNWLVLIEACSSHGPVDHKRHVELKEIFGTAKAGLVFVTVFPDSHVLAKYLRHIAWETEVWIAENPDHLIHFNGERFLGPYE